MTGDVALRVEDLEVVLVDSGEKILGGGRTIRRRGQDGWIDGLE